MIATLLRRWRRWRAAEARGFALAGSLFGLREPEASGFRGRWVVRNANRLYRLTGHGNPWRPYRGY